MQDELRRGRHVVYRIHAHLVFVPRYRRKVFDRDALERLRATFAAVLVALFLMHPAELHRAARVPPARGQVREGLRHAWGRWELRIPLLMMAVIGALAFNFTVLLPLYSSDVFHRGTGSSGAGGFGILLTTMGVGVA